jgi:DNA-binding XRE family transcriptional regulator
MDGQDPQTRDALERVEKLIEVSQARMPSPLPTPEWRRRLREMQRLTTREVAKACGVSAATVSAWEGGRLGLVGHDPNGRNRVVYAELLRRIAELHDVTPEMARSGRIVRPVEGDGQTGVVKNL